MSALSLQGVLGYNVGKVLNTPLEAEHITPVSSDFFTSKDYLWPSSEQEYNTRKGNIVGRLLAVFKYSAAHSEQVVHEQTRRRPIMAIHHNGVSAPCNTQSQSFKNYVVCFSDGRIKVGFTSNVKQRMRSYIREAKRSGAHHITWWTSTSFSNKKTALLMERLMCNSYKHMAVPGFREWFEGDSKDFEKIIKQAEFVRDFLSAGKIENKDELVGWWSDNGILGVRA
jgi:hypothetical protein